MGWSNVASTLLEAFIVIVEGGITGAGIFVYSSTPALGNLIGSWTAVSGTDAFGNSYPAGLALYDSSSVLIGNWNTSGFTVKTNPGSGQVFIQAAGASGASPAIKISSGGQPANTQVGSMQALNGVIVPNMDSLLLSGPQSPASVDAHQSYAYAAMTQGGANNGATGQLIWWESNAGAHTRVQWDSSGATIPTLTTSSITATGGTISETAISFDLGGGNLLVYSTTSTTVTHNAAGSGTFVVPAGVTSLQVQCWGGGGSGGSPLNQGGGGGGGGEYAAETALAVTPLETLNWAVGAGSTTSANGGDSTFKRSTTTLVIAHGGTTSNNATGQPGGTGSTNTVHFNGGAGGNGATDGSGNGSGGGGGSSAGTAAIGGGGANAVSGLTGHGGSGGSAPSGGGNGGTGGNVNASNGANGGAPGGGGGGAPTGAFGSGNGADGKVVITYTSPAVLIGSWSPAAGTDSSGNAYPAGFAAQDVLVGGFTALGDNGVGRIELANATTVPTTNPTGGGVLYAKQATPTWRDSGGHLLGMVRAYSARANSDLLNFTTEADVPGATVSVVVTGSNATIYANVNFDMQLNTSATNLVGFFNWNGADQAQQSIFIVPAAGGRATVGQNYVITGVTAGTYTAKLRASCGAAGGSNGVRQPHTGFSLLVIDQ